MPRLMALTLLRCQVELAQKITESFEEQLVLLQQERNSLLEAQGGLKSNVQQLEEQVALLLQDETDSDE